MSASRTYPEPYATIAREREKGTPADELAAMLNVHSNTVRSWVREWNRSNPNNPIPRRKYLKTALYAQAAEMHLRGMTREEIAEHFKVTPLRVSNMFTQARNVGLLPRKPAKLERGGYAAYEAHYVKGIAPKMGAFRTIMDALTTQELNRLLDRIDHKADTTLAHTLARIVKEHLSDNPKGR